MILLIARTGKTVFAGLIVLVLLGLFIVNYRLLTGPASGSLDYRVFVAGIGTVEGKWSGETGIAIVGTGIRPAEDALQELKVIDLLVANKSSEKLMFKSDIALIDKLGRRFELKAEGQPEVSINPGALSQGTVIINVPKGVPDHEWVLEVKGGNLRETVLLPLRILKVQATN